MKIKNTITLTITLIFALVITSIGTFSIATKFDWIIFAIGISLGVISITLDVVFFQVIDNHEEVLSLKFELYKTLRNKVDLSVTMKNITISRNKKIISCIHLFCCEDKKIDLTLTDIERKIQDNTLIDYLHANNLDKKLMKLIKNEIKYYNYDDDLNSIVRTFESKELITKQNVGVIPILITILGFIITTLCFFKIDYSSINFTVNFIFLLINFMIGIFGTWESCKNYKKVKKEYYVILIKIWKTEEFD